MSLTGDEINYVIYQYLKEANFTHSAFTLFHESRLRQSPLFDKKPTPESGRLVQVLRKGLLYIQVEETLRRQDASSSSGPSSSKVTLESSRAPRLLDDLSLDSKDDIIETNSSMPAQEAPLVNGVEMKEDADKTVEETKPNDMADDTEVNPKGSKRQKPNSTKSSTKVSFSSATSPGPPVPPVTGQDLPMEVDQVGTPETESVVEKKAPDIIFLKGHTSEAVSAAWNPSATNILVTGGGDASARIWDVSGPLNADGYLSTNFNCRHLPALPDQKTVSCLDWHPEGSLLATGSMDGQARLWTPEGDLHAVSASHGNAIYALKFNPAGTLLVTVSQDTNVIASDLSGRKKATWSIHPGSAMDIDWLDADTFATCSKDVKICRASSPGNVSAVFKGHTGEINVVRWHGSGDGLLASCGDEGEVRIWRYDKTKPGQMDKDELKALHVFSGPKEMYCMKWQPWEKGSPNADARILAAGSFDGVVRCFDAKKGTILHILQAHQEHIYSIAFSPTDPWILGTVSLDRRLCLWDTVSGEKVFEYTASGGVLDLAWKTDGRQVALCTAAKLVPLLNIDVEQLKRRAAGLEEMVPFVAPRDDDHGQNGTKEGQKRKVKPK